MTTEQKQIINQYKGQRSKGVAMELKRLAEQIEGAPRTTDCFCSSTAWQNYLKDFYNWYDANNPNEENNVTNE